MTSPKIVAPTRAIPARPNLEFDRKQAKSLLAALEAQEPEALARLAARHPRQAIPGAELKLADAQLVIAREYGFTSWPQWKTFVETRGLERRRQAEIALKASCSSDLARARLLLNADPELASEDPYLACAAGEIGPVRAALSREPDWINRAGGVNGWMPLHYACFSRWLRADAGRAGRIVEIVKLLLDAGADPNAGFDEEGYRQVSLYGAAGIANNAALTRLLLEAGADVDDGYPPADPNDMKVAPWGTETLYHASEFADTTCLEMVLARRPDPVRVSFCIYRAIDHDNAEAVRLFLQAGADPNLCVSHLGAGNSLHFSILRKAGVDILRQLLEAGGDPRVLDREGYTPYRRAVSAGREDLAALFLEYGASPDEALVEDRLQGALMRGQSVEQGELEKIPAHLLCQAALFNNLPAIQALLAAGANVNGDGEGTMCPVHEAAWRGHFEAVKILVENGANILQKNSYGGHALGTAIHGSENCFNLMGGPGMKLPEEAHAGQYPEIVAYLLAHGAPKPEHIWGGSAPVREILRAHGVPDEAR